MPGDNNVDSYKTGICDAGVCEHVGSACDTDNCAAAYDWPYQQHPHAYG